ncbi:RNA polymerase sigma factor [Catenovulum agarivorans]|uniref:RNA polymerase sigma factor n=1 Tax=Catenovulum agarivorans TaxID=1172192 RepID=UPI000313E979|nr:RNA polymerase sigma factor [Catenovulum agarivorans]
MWASKIASIYQEHRSSLHRFIASKLADSELVKDIAQEAYLRLLRVDNSKNIDNPQAYLFTIARNLLNEHYAAKKHSKVSLDDEVKQAELAEVLVDHRLAEHEVDSLQKDLIQAIAVLPQIQQQVILMHRRDGMTYDEIANSLGTTKGMVKKHLVKAVVQCKAYLRKCGYEQ